jgi:hypothetical protein
MVLQTGGPWTTITWDADEVLPPSPQITRTGGVFTCSQTGIYLVKYFMAYNIEDGAWANYLISHGRVIKNGSTVIDQSYSNSGHYSAYGRNGRGHSFLVYLTAGDTLELQYRVQYRVTQYTSTPAPDIGGPLTTTSSPAGPATSSMGIERVDEFDNPACIAMHLTASTHLAAITTWYDYTRWDLDGVEDVRSWFASPNASGEFTIPEDGYYLIGYSLQPDYIAFGALYNQRVRTRWQKNGVTIPHSQATVGIHTTLGWNCATHNFVEFFNAGDLVKMQNNTTDVATTAVWNNIGGVVGTVYREWVTSVFFLKVSDHAGTEEVLASDPGDEIEATTAGASAVPTGWIENHDDTTSPPIQFHINGTTYPVGATKSLRYARDSTNNFDNSPATANSGDITTNTFSVPSGPSIGGAQTAFSYLALDFDVLNDTEGSTSYDVTTIEIWATGLGLVQSFGGTFFPFNNSWVHRKYTFVNTSLLGRSDVYLVIKFDTLDDIGNGTTGLHLANIQITGLKQ